MSSPQQRRRQRANLFMRQGGKCYWCGQPMVLPHHGMKPRNNHATIDHIFSRLHPARKKDGSEHEKVAACKKCNLERARAESVAQSAGVLLPFLAVAKNYTPPRCPKFGGLPKWLEPYAEEAA